MQRKTRVIKNEPRILTGNYQRLTIDRQRKNTQTLETNWKNVEPRWKIIEAINNFTILPTVQAAPKPPEKSEPPEKPPRMKHSDLPLQNSPHAKYGEYIRSQYYCPGYNQKFIHKMIHPYVKKYRTPMKAKFDSYQSLILTTAINCNNYVTTKKIELKKQMRDENNVFRPAVVAVGVGTGFLYGSRSRLVLRTIFWTGVGTLFTGWLCYPKETDAQFRKLVWETSRFILTLCSIYCGRPIGMSQNFPCFVNLGIDEKLFEERKECADKKKKK